MIERYYLVRRGKTGLLHILSTHSVIQSAIDSGASAIDRGAECEDIMVLDYYHMAPLDRAMLTIDPHPLAQPLLFIGPGETDMSPTTETEPQYRITDAEIDPIKRLEADSRISSYAISRFRQEVEEYAAFVLNCRVKTLLQKYASLQKVG